MYPADDTLTTAWHDELFKAVCNQKKIPPVVVHPSHIAGIDTPKGLSAQFQWISLLPNNHWLPYLRLDGRSSGGKVALLQHLVYQPFQPVRQPMPARLVTGETVAPSTTMDVTAERQLHTPEATSDLLSIDELFRIAMELQVPTNEETGEIENGESSDEGDRINDDELLRRWLPTSLRNRLLYFTVTTTTAKHKSYVRSLIEFWIKRVDANDIEINHSKKKVTPHAVRRSRINVAVLQRETPEMLEGGVPYEYATNVGGQNRTLYSDFADRLLVGGTLVLRSYDRCGGVIIMNSFDSNTGEIQPSMYESIQFRKIVNHGAGADASEYNRSDLSLRCSCSTFHAFQGQAKQEIDPLGEVDPRLLTCFHCRFVTDYLREPCLSLESLDYQQETALFHALSESKRNHGNKPVVLLGDIVAGQPIKFSVKCNWSKPAFVHISADRRSIMCRRGMCKSSLPLRNGQLDAVALESKRLCEHLRLMSKCVDFWKHHIVSCDGPLNVPTPARRYECKFNTESGFWEVQDCLSKHKPTESDTDERLIK